MSENPLLVSATLENFMDTVINPSREIPVLIDFWAAWCAPCKMLMPLLENIARDYQGRLKVVKVNADEQPELTQQAGVRALPTVLLVKDGRVIDQFNEALPDSQIRAFLDKHVANFYDPLINTAREQLAAGQASAAFSFAQQAKAAAPAGYWPAIEVYVQSLIAIERFDSARDELNGLPYEVRHQPAAQVLFAALDVALQSENLGELDGLRDAYAQSQSEQDGIALALGLCQQHKAQEAFVLLCALIARAEQRKECAAYKTMVELLQSVKDPQVVNQARRQLYQLLY
ncbi:MAG: thioredoxin [Oceanospirillaceae bacterium]|nr:thioredoxin [Oceanospirillaceae bacterium]